MSLMKLFNKDYFKENLRKSKGLLAFFLGVIPLINILVLIVGLIDLKGDIAVLDFQNISVVTFLGMYVIPVLLALTLLGFVYKRKSVDFVLAKPISRKTIYITNILGGMGVLTLFILLNSFIFFLFNIFSSLVIPFPLIIDYFIFFLVAYVFVFLLSVLGISLAGNFMGTIVVVLIVLCLFPFVKVSNLYFTVNSDSKSYIRVQNDYKPDVYSCGENYMVDSKCEEMVNKGYYPIRYSRTLDNDFVAPLLILNNEEVMEYNLTSIIKMILLSLVYGVIGFYLFVNRKMENNETSFKNEILHYVVKCITLIPICFITYLIIRDEPLVGFIVSIVIILIYSCLYDLITRREIYKFMRSTGLSLVVMGILLGIYTLRDNVSKDRLLGAADIQYLEYGYSNPVIIKDKDVINTLIKNTLSRTYGQSSYKMMANDKMYEIMLDDGEKSQSLIKTVVAQTKKEKYENFDIDRILYVDNMVLTKELKELIIDTYNKLDFNNLDFDTGLITVGTYKNHKYEEIILPKKLNKELDKYVLEYNNKKALALLNEEDIPHFSIYDNSGLTAIDRYVFSYVIEENISDFKKYIETQNNEYKDSSTTISIAGSKYILLDIGDRDKFLEEFRKYKARVEDTDQYKTLVRQYNNYYYED